MSATTEVRERPILFSGAMVRAILDGSKTQTRRVLTLKRRGGRGGPVVANPAYVERWKNEPAHAWASECPYGAPGDRLWVREAWQYADWTEDGQPFVRYAADGALRFCEGAGEGETLVDTWATLSEHSNYSIDGKAADRRWRPSIHIPRWASRLTLELTDVRVARLQDISGMDAAAEGIEYDVWDQCAVTRKYDEPDAWFQMWDEDAVNFAPMERLAIESYRTLWDTINAKRGFGWDVNPWVWALSFRRVESAT